MASLLKHYTVYKGKRYGFFTLDGKFTKNIRSEDNPDKTPYLKAGSKLHSEISRNIEALLAVK